MPNLKGTSLNKLLYRLFKIWEMDKGVEVLFFAVNSVQNKALIQKISKNHLSTKRF